MPTRAWAFDLQGIRHVVELEHTHRTGRRRIVVDGMLVYRSKYPFDFVREQRFSVSGAPCTLRIMGSEFGDYQLLVGGNRVSPVDYS